MKGPFDFPWPEMPDSPIPAHPVELLDQDHEPVKVLDTETVLALYADVQSRMPGQWLARTGRYMSFDPADKEGDTGSVLTFQDGKVVSVQQTPQKWIGGYLDTQERTQHREVPSCRKKLDPGEFIHLPLKLQPITTTDVQVLQRGIVELESGEFIDIGAPVCVGEDGKVRNVRPIKRTEHGWTLCELIPVTVKSDKQDDQSNKEG